MSIYGYALEKKKLFYSTKLILFFALVLFLCFMNGSSMQILKCYRRLVCSSRNPLMHLFFVYTAAPQQLIANPSMGTSSSARQKTHQHLRDIVLNDCYCCS